MFLRGRTSLFAEGTVSVTLLSLAHQLAASGLTWQSAAATLGGLGTLLLGLAGVLREIRAFRDARAR